MPKFPPYAMPITCPQCQARLSVLVYSIIDGEDMPDVVDALAMGVLNTFPCPRCGATLVARVPVLYHHGSKQLAFLYIPPEANLSMEQRQRVVGDLTRAVMQALPQEHPKGYLLQPREFLQWESFVEAVMQVHGISKEEIEARRRKAELVDKFLLLVDDPVAFAAAVGEHKADLDEEFFALLRAARNYARAIGREKEAEKLETVRQKLLPLTPAGRRERAREKALAFVQKGPDRKAFLQALLEAEDEEEVKALVAAARPLADYRFFQMLAERIERAKREGKTEEAKRLEQLRDQVLRVAEEVDTVAQQRVTAARELLNTLMSAKDLDKAVEEHADEIDDLFLYVLSQELAHAEEHGAEPVVRRLLEVRDAISRYIARHIPPELALVEALLSLEYPGETRRFLEEHREIVQQDFVDFLAAMATRLEQEGAREAAKRLRGIRAQAVAMLSEQGAKEEAR